MGIVEAIINGLKEREPHFQLFFDTHYTIEKETSLRPEMHSDGTPYFPEREYIVPKKLTLKEKEEYYMKDLNLWGKLNGEIKHDSV